MLNNPLISVIIPVYNVETYLAECLDSILHQTIGFTKNVELILINDGSSDKSGEICRSYQARFPNNILFIEQANSGVSASRNKGIELSHGQFLNFIDSDDVLDADAFEKGVRFLGEKSDVDVVAFRLKYFGRQNNFHMLDEKFRVLGTSVVDIREHPSYLLLHLPTTLIRRSALGEIRFDTQLFVSEDTKVLYQLILPKGKYGIIDNTKYNYRRRGDGSSAIQRSRTEKHWYQNSMERGHKFLVQLSRSLFGEVLPYVQYFNMYDLQWRLKDGIMAPLNRTEREDYLANIRGLLLYIEDTVIADQKDVDPSVLMLAFSIKYGNQLPSLLHWEEDGLYLASTRIGGVDAVRCRLSELELSRDGTLLLIGAVFFPGSYRLLLQHGEQQIPLVTYPRPELFPDFPNTLNIQGFTVNVPLKKRGQIRLMIVRNDSLHPVYCHRWNYPRLSNFKRNYAIEHGYQYLYNNDTATLSYQPALPFCSRLHRELATLLELVKSKRKDIARARLLYWLTKPFFRKEVWLFADREIMGRDSAEAVFRHFLTHNTDGNKRAYFVVHRSFPDYARLMAETKQVVSYNSLRYKLLVLNAKYLVSSHADYYVNNPFGYASLHYTNIMRFRYIYLTHGVLLHDSSHWLNRINKNICLNVVTSPKEYETLLSGPYYFSPQQLLQTGLPRYDNYRQEEVPLERKICFMPSWRQALAGSTIPGSQRRLYNPQFKESEYYLFYNRLLNDKQLIHKLQEKDLYIKFCVHPSFRAQLKDFVGNERVSFAIDVDGRYEALSSLAVVTDYSSAACDFAFLNKPVIYANFDRDTIEETHYYKSGYFDYDKDGFGPNCTDYESTLHAILNLIDRDFRVEPIYQERMDRFFYYKDHHSAQRVYDAILAYDQEN